MTDRETAERLLDQIRQANAHLSGDDWDGWIGSAIEEALAAARASSPPRDLSPPWVVFHCEGRADILPAMRPGAVVEGLPLDLAQRIVAVANGASPPSPGLVEAARLALVELDHAPCRDNPEHTRCLKCAAADALRAALAKEPTP